MDHRLWPTVRSEAPRPPRRPRQRATWRAATTLNATLRYCPVLATEPEERCAAIVDFTFNPGAGRGRCRHCGRPTRGTGQQHRVGSGNGVFAGGVRLRGLVLWRAEEASFLACDD